MSNPFDKHCLLSTTLNSTDDIRYELLRDTIDSLQHMLDGSPLPFCKGLKSIIEHNRELIQRAIGTKCLSKKNPAIDSQNKQASVPCSSTYFEIGGITASAMLPQSFVKMADKICL